MREMQRMKALEESIGSTYASPDVETIISNLRSDQIDLVKLNNVHTRISCGTQGSITQAYFAKINRKYGSFKDTM